LLFFPAVWLARQERFERDHRLPLAACQLIGAR
jgi:hypothetical protein